MFVDIHCSGYNDRLFCAKVTQIKYRNQSNISQDYSSTQIRTCCRCRWWGSGSHGRRPFKQ